MHRAEEILEAVTTALTGLTTTGNRVERDRVYPPELCPALSVGLGQESPKQGADNVSYQDSILEVRIVIQVKNDDTATVLNQIKAEVYAALMSDRTLGLSFVADMAWNGDSEPEPSGDAEIKTTRCITNFAVWYRHSFTSKEA